MYSRAPATAHPYLFHRSSPVYKKDPMRPGELRHPFRQCTAGRRECRDVERSGCQSRRPDIDRKSTRLKSSHLVISYAVFCLKKKTKTARFRSNNDQLSLSDTAYSPHHGYHLMCSLICFIFFFNDTATTEIYTLSLHDALPICAHGGEVASQGRGHADAAREQD